MYNENKIIILYIYIFTLNQELPKIMAKNFMKMKRINVDTKVIKMHFLYFYLYLSLSLLALFAVVLIVKIIPKVKNVLLVFL